MWNDKHSLLDDLERYASYFFVFLLPCLQWMNWLMAAAGELWLLQCVFMSCSSSCRAAEQVTTLFITTCGEKCVSSASMWHRNAFITFPVASPPYQVPPALSATCALSCGSACSSTPTVWSKCASSPTCTLSPCAGTWAERPVTCWGASTAAPRPSTACSGRPLLM